MENNKKQERLNLLLEDLGVDGQEKEELRILFFEAEKSADVLSEKSPFLARIPLNPLKLLLYLLSEERFFYQQMKLEKNEDSKRKIISTALDKYFTNEHLSFRSETFTTRFRPEISTISLYLNFILGILKRYRKNEPQETLIVDIMQKGFSMAKCIVGLLIDGFETEAFSTWRTLHENECILLILVRHGEPVIKAYLEHLRYAMAFRGAFASKEETDAVFLMIKEGMRKADLKSKDMKRFIEYGWLLTIPEVNQIPDFKLNFRDGVERVADLRQYAKVYEMSSEIAHSSPLLIYSREAYFHYLTLLNLYESFFRLEKVFSNLYLASISKKDEEQYITMRNLYFEELKECYRLSKERFSSINEEKKS